MLSHARVRVRAAAAGDSSALARHRLGKELGCTRLQVRSAGPSAARQGRKHELQGLLPSSSSEMLLRGGMSAAGLLAPPAAVPAGSGGCSGAQLGVCHSLGTARALGHGRVNPTGT